MNTAGVATRLIRVFLSELDERLTAFDADLVALEGSSEDERAETVTRLFRGAHSLKGAAASVGASAIEITCQRLEDELASLRDDPAKLDAPRCEALFAVSDALREAGRKLAGEAAPAPVAAVAAAAPAAPAAPEPAPAPAAAPPASRVGLREATLRVRPETVDALLEQSGELLVAHHRSRDLYNDVLDADATVQRMRERSAKDVSAKRYRDDLQTLQRSLERIAAGMERERLLQQRTSTELDDGIRAIRMVPFEQACEGLERVVRDAAKATGKRVALEIADAHIGVDRATIERLRDPIVHLIRNAIDHGIEPPDERIRLGKPAEGRVRLAAHPRTREFEVVVSDDGRGLDLGALRKRMIARGLPFDENDLASSVLLPGVSTAANVTKLSGRGVGLDVVRSEVEAMHGSITITSVPGRGVTFALRFPMTTTTHRAVLVSAGGQTFVINVAGIGRVVPVDPKNVTSVEGSAVLLDGGEPIPMLPLHAVIGIAPAAETQPIAVILVQGNRRAAVTVDALVDEREIHMRPLGPRLRGLPHVAGATIGGDGSVIIMLRSSVLLQSTLNMARSVRTAAPGAPAGARAKRVLLVDDSVTTRALERSILEAAGFDVLTAPDGHEAWQLLAHENVDLVVSDVDMPRMDGFALTETIRASEKHRELPVVLVTARNDEQDRRRGLEAGADAYIVKSSFRQEELLEAIGALT